jgi:hypothetical protein
MKAEFKNPYLNPFRKNNYRNEHLKSDPLDDQTRIEEQSIRGSKFLLIDRSTKNKQVLATVINCFVT